MVSLRLILLVLSLVLALLATFGVSGAPRFNLLAGAFAAFIAAILFGGLALS